MLAGALALSALALGAAGPSASSGPLLRRLSPAPRPERRESFGTTALRGARPAAKSAAHALPRPAVVAPTLGALLAAPQFPIPEGLAVFAADCQTPKSEFHVGETVCVKATGDLLEPRRIYWIIPVGEAVQVDEISPTANEARRVVQTRGPWSLYLSSGLDGTLRARSFFSVRDEQNPSADLAVTTIINRTASAFAPGGRVVYSVFVANKGPDPAANVVFNAPPPNDSTLFAFGQQSGPAFNCSTSGDNCTIASLAAGAAAALTYTYEIDSGTPIGTEIVYTTAVSSDTEELHAADNSARTAASVTDATAPEQSCTLECPNDIIVTATDIVNSVPSATVFFEADFSGDCGAITSSHPSGTFFPEGPTTVTVSAAGGGSCSFTVTVIDPADLPAPTITCPPDKSAIAAAGALETAVDPGTTTTTGTVLSVTGTRSDGLSRLLTDPYPVGETTITWVARDTAPDADGLFPPLTRSATCQQRIVVTSNDAPTISCPADKSFTAPSGQCEMTLTAAQIGEPTTTGTGVTVVGARSDGRPLSDPFPSGPTVITWTATDSAGRVVSCTQTVNVSGSGVDNTPPVLHVPADVEVLTDSCSAVVDDELGAATATDSCGGGVKITRSGVPTGPVVIRRPFPLPPLIVQLETFIFPVGTTVLTYTATDTAGNVTTGTQRVIVRERTATPPSITAPPDLELSTGAGATSCGLFIADAVLGTASASDNCPGVQVARAGVPAGNLFPVGVTEITHTATDASGNTTSVVQKVTVRDDTPPIVSVPADITVTLPANTADTSMPVTYAVTADDNCPGVALNVSPASGSVFHVGTTVVTATATDAHGNSTTLTFNVTVLYNFNGFFSPVANPPTLNVVNAGRAIPLKFSLSGNKGLNIFAANSPASQQVACDTSAPVSDVQETATAGDSSLSYSATSDQYTYVWATEGSWAGTCRQLVLTLNDGSTHAAKFKFR